MVFEFLLGPQTFSIEKNIFLPVNANTNWHMMLVAYFCQSLLTEGRTYFNKDEWRAACRKCLISLMWRLTGQCYYQVGVRLAKSGVWLAVRRKYLQLSNGKPTLLTNGGTSKRIGTLIQPLKGRHITRPKAHRQPVSLNCANNIMSQLMFAFTGINSVPRRLYFPALQ